MVEQPNQGELLLSQPDIIARLERYFGKEVSNLKKYQILLPQSFHIVQPENGSTTLSQGKDAQVRIQNRITAILS